MDADPAYQGDMKGRIGPATELRTGELVVVTEDVWGSPVQLSIGADGSEAVRTQGEPCEAWQAMHHGDSLRSLRTLFPHATVQVFGTMIPTQDGFHYGLTEPRVRWSRLLVQSRALRVGTEVPLVLWSDWVPILYIGPFDRDRMAAFAEGSERVSGYALHPRRGIVVEPATPRLSATGRPLVYPMGNPHLEAAPKRRIHR